MYRTTIPDSSIRKIEIPSSQLESPSFHTEIIIDSNLEYEEIFDRIEEIEAVWVGDDLTQENVRRFDVPTPETIKGDEISRIVFDKDGISIDHGIEKPDAPQIITPPWYRLKDVARFVAGRRYVDAVIVPTLSDVQHEYYEALKVGNDKEASVVKWRGLIQLIWRVLISPAERVISRFRSSLG